MSQPQEYMQKGYDYTKQTGEQAGQQMTGEKPQDWTAWSYAKLAGGLTLGGGLLAALVFGGGLVLLLATPVILFTAPLWIPVVIFLTVTTGGLLALAVGSYVAYQAFSWVYNYMKNESPQMAEQIDQYTGKIKGAAGEFRDRSREYGERAMGKAQ